MDVLLLLSAECELRVNASVIYSRVEGRDDVEPWGKGIKSGKMLMRYAWRTSMYEGTWQEADGGDEKVMRSGKDGNLEPRRTRAARWLYCIYG